MTTSEKNSNSQTGVAAGGHYVDRLVRVCSCGNPLAPWEKATVCVECNRVNGKKQYEKNKARQNARRAEWYRKNPERSRAYAHSRPKVNRYQKKPRNKCRCGRDAAFSEKCKRCYRAEYRLTHKEKARASQRRSRASLPNYYIRHLLTSYGTTLKPSDIPQPLVELKREQLKLKKLCKKSRTSTS